MPEQLFWRDAALPFVESRRATDSGACYVPHSHPAISVGVVDSGHSRFACGDRSARLEAGDLVFVPPEAVHSCNPDAACVWSYQMLYLDRSWVAAVTGAGPDGSGQGPLPGPAVVRDEALYATFCRLNALLFSAAPAPEKEKALRGFVGDLLGRLARKGEAGRTLPDRLGRVRSVLAERCAERWPLAELMAISGMNRRRLIRAFKDETGMTPHAYLLDQRVNRAKAMLRAGVALARVAQELSFADQSHFQRAFKRHAAITPKRYRRPG